MNQQEPPAVVVAEPVGHEGARVEIRQRPAAMVSGWLGVAVLLGCVAATIVAARDQAGGWTAVPIVVFFVVLSTLVIVSPGQSQVLQFFGSYVGTVRRPGLWSAVPLTVRRAVSVRVRNF